MNGDRESKRKLAGGYASGNLSESEQKELFEAALRDQGLFDELVDEQAFKELLDAPGVREELIGVLQPKPGRWDRLRAWWSRPVAWGATGAVATAALVLMVVSYWPGPPVAQKTAGWSEVAGVVQPQDAAQPRMEVQKRQDQQAVEKKQTKAPTPTSAKQSIPEARQNREAPAPPARATAAAEAPELDRLREPATTNVAAPPAVAAATPPAAVVPPPPPAKPPATAAVLRDQAQSAKTEQAGELKKEVRLARQAVPAAASTVTAQYALLRRDADGRFAAVPAGVAVSPSDELRLQIIPSVNGSVTLYRRGPDGTRTRLLSQPASAGDTVQLPIQVAVGPQTFLVTVDRGQPEPTTVNAFQAPGAAKRAPASVPAAGASRKVTLPAETGSRVSAESVAEPGLTLEIMIVGAQ